MINCPFPNNARRSKLNNKLATSKVTRRIAACHRGTESTRYKEPRKLSRRPQTVHTQAHAHANVSKTHTHTRTHARTHTHTHTNRHMHARTHTHTHRPHTYTDTHIKILLIHYSYFGASPLFVLLTFRFQHWSSDSDADHTNGPTARPGRALNSSGESVLQPPLH